MDPRLFDGLSRQLARRLPRRALPPLVAALGLTGLTARETDAKDCKRGEKKCGKRCIPKKRCCNDKNCENGTSCRRGRCLCPAQQQPCGGQCLGAEGAPCTTFTTCCSGGCDSLVGGGTCSPCVGFYCDANYPCCPGTPCINNRCGGCLGRAIVCGAGSPPCCQSDCNGGACLSGPGGRCKYNPDCRTCYSDLDRCTGACVGGVCQF